MPDPVDKKKHMDPTDPDPQHWFMYSMNCRISDSDFYSFAIF